MILGALSVERNKIYHTFIIPARKNYYFNFFPYFFISFFKCLINFCYAKCAVSRET